ncbi:MAG: patatin-like phospholipase family protein [Flavobacteriaceae bacterium]|nr:patatin-like phospholipase family protein [Flavobacteriaceae bacterium]
MKHPITFCLALFVLIVTACSHPEIQESATPEKICLVLSVGASKGLAHIGVIDALKEEGIPISCVYGNSMGSIIGSLYATAPSANLKVRYKEFIGKYEEVTKREVAQRGLLFGLGVLALSGGTVGWESVLGGATLGAVSVEKFDFDRFKGVLNDYFAHALIERLPMPFATSYQMKQGQGMDLVVVQQGNLADAVSKSANNPFMFKSANFDDPLDPGADRIAAVPIEDAVRLFHPTQVIAVNVTGNPVFYTKDAGVIVKEITIFVKDRDEAMKGFGQEFDNIYRLGYLATKKVFH